MNKREELKGLVKEMTQEVTKEDTAKWEERMSALETSNTTLTEQNEEYKTQIEDLQDTTLKFQGKAGGGTYKYKGYNPEFNKNFKGTLTEDEAEKVAKVYLDMVHGKAIDFASEMPTEFGETVMGLAELNSSSLSTMRVIDAGAPIVKLPVKATRETADVQSSATANTSTSITAATITWTIDKRIGSYAEVRVDQLEDANFDIVNDFVVPLQAEAIGQYCDAEVFNRTNSEFTTAIVDATASVTASGTVATAAAITLANLNTMFYSVEWERGLGDCKWYGSRAALKDVMGLTDTYGQPVMRTVPVNGRPVHYVFGSQYVITPKVANAPGDGAIRLAFGDPNQYIIFTRGGTQNLVNPYILMKEDVVQFVAKARMDGNVADHATASSSGAWTSLKRVDA